MTHVEIVSVGDELLRGIVQETNAHWIAKRLAARGAALSRVVLVPDDVEVVAAELRQVLAREPVMVFTHGGLGPTDDDRTREALAAATGRALELHAEAEAIVRRRYTELAAAGTVAEAAMNEARLRMARLPHGAGALDNQIGAAPGIVIPHGSTTIVALPGVPPELVWIWENPLAPILHELLGPGGFGEVTLTLEMLDESSIVELLRTVQGEHPGVYVKSRAKGFGSDDHVRVTLAARGKSTGGAVAMVARAEADLRTALRAEGIAVLDT